MFNTQTNLVKVFVWCDGDWCYSDDLEFYSKSDDYQDHWISVPDSCQDADKFIDTLIPSLLNTFIK